MRILWIKDDPDISEKEFFGSNVFKAHEIVQIREFETAAKVISEDLEQYDYIIIDIINGKYIIKITKCFRINIITFKFNKIFIK